MLLGAANQPATTQRQKAALERLRAEGDIPTVEAATRTLVRDLRGHLATTTVLSRARDLQHALYKTGNAIDAAPMWCAALRGVRRGIGPLPRAQETKPLASLWAEVAKLKGTCGGRG